MVEFDLETLEPVLNRGNIHPSDIVDEHHFLILQGKVILSVPEDV